MNPSPIISFESTLVSLGLLFIFQIFLGQSAPIDRDLVWPWAELIFVNASVLVAVVIALLLTTRRALKSDLAIVLKGE